MNLNYFDLTTKILELAVAGNYTNEAAFFELFGKTAKQSDHPEYHSIIISGLFSDITGNPNKILKLSIDGLKCYADLISIKQAKKYSNIALWFSGISSFFAFLALIINIIMILK